MNSDTFAGCHLTYHIVLGKDSFFSKQKYNKNEVNYIFLSMFMENDNKDFSNEFYDMQNIRILFCIGIFFPCAMLFSVVAHKCTFRDIYTFVLIRIILCL